MHTVQGFPTEYRLIRRNNSFESFPTLLSAAQAAYQRGWLFSHSESQLGNDFSPVKIKIGWDRLSARVIHGEIAPVAIARTHLGDAITVETMWAALRESWRRTRWGDRPYSYRSEPVPGIGRCHRYCWHRAPRTFRERRLRLELAVDAEEADRLLQGLGRIRELPSERDDLRRGGERSWKRHRRTQYRPLE